MCRCGIAGWFWVSCLNSVKVIFSATPPQKRLLGQKRLLAASYFVVCCPPKGKQNKAKERLDAYTSRESQECALANGTDVTAPSVEAMPKRANPPPLTRSLVQVLNASGLPATFPRQFTYFTVDIRDKEGANILSAIGAVNIFIEAGIEKGGVLVHCAGGRSRSAAFVVAFILSTQGCGYDLAYAQVQRARPVASVNRGFEQQLRAYDAAQCNVFIAHQMMLRVRAAALVDRRDLLLSLKKSEMEGDGEDSGVADGVGTGQAKMNASMPLACQQQQQQQQHHHPAGVWPAAGIPPTPTFSRGKGRSSAGGNPLTAHRQGRGSGGGASGAGAVVPGSSAVAGATATGPEEKGQEEHMHFLPKEPRPTRLRLCRPGSASVRVMPPLKTLERIYACRNCGAYLLTGGHLMKLDMELPSIETVLSHTAPRSLPEQQQGGPSSGPPVSSPRSLCPPTPSVAATVARGPSLGEYSYPQQATGQEPAALRDATKDMGVGGDDSCGCRVMSNCVDGIPAEGASAATTRSSTSPPLDPSGRSHRAGMSSGGGSTASAPLRRSLSTGKADRRPPGISILEPNERPPVHHRSAEGRPTAPPAAGGSDPCPPPQASTTGVVGEKGGGGVEGIGPSAVRPMGQKFTAESCPEFTTSSCRLRPQGIGRAGTEGVQVKADRGGAGGTGRTKTAFGFESEEDESNVADIAWEVGTAPAEAYPTPAEALQGNDGGGFRLGSGGVGMDGGVAGAGSLGDPILREGLVGKAAGNPPQNRPVQPSAFTFLLSSRGPSSQGSGMESVSPLVTPRSPRTPVSCGSSSPCASETSLGRCQSAEKRQFLLQMHMVESRAAASAGARQLSQASTCTEADRYTDRLDPRPAGRWLHADHLEWMGDIMAAPSGRIHCPNASCGVELGSWNWDDADMMGVKSPTGPAIIRLDKDLMKPTRSMVSNLESRSSFSRDNSGSSSRTSSTSLFSGQTSASASVSNYVTLKSSSSIQAAVRSINLKPDPDGR